MELWPYTGSLPPEPDDALVPAAEDASLMILSGGMDVARARYGRKAVENLALAAVKFPYSLRPAGFGVLGLAEVALFFAALNVGSSALMGYGTGVLMGPLVLRFLLGASREVRGRWTKMVDAEVKKLAAADGYKVDP